MTRRIIVEGPDGAGKSTLVEQLLVQGIAPFELIVSDGPGKNFDIWWANILSREPNATVPLHDRFFYSELVYGPALRGHITAAPSTLSWVRRTLRASSLLIYARPSSDTIRAGAAQHQQMEGVNNRLTQLIELYDMLMREEQPHYGARFTQYAWNVPGELDRVVHLIYKYLDGGLT